MSVTLTLAATAERTVSLSSEGTLFTIGSGVTLTMGNNVTLQGRDGSNTAPRGTAAAQRLPQQPR